MQKLSYWAKTHPWSARFIIVSGLLLLSGLGILTGLLLRDLQTELPYYALLVFAGLGLAGLLFYPSRRPVTSCEKLKRRHYRWQKSCDFVLAASTFLFMLFISNQHQQFFSSSRLLSTVAATTPSLPRDSSLKTYKPIQEFAASVRDENGKLLKWKERKKLLKEQIRAIKHSREPSNGGKTALIILSVLVALGLILLLSALACGIACNGSGVLAVLVLVLGTGLVIFLLVRTINRITGKRKKEIKNPETGPPKG